MELNTLPLDMMSDVTASLSSPKNILGRQGTPDEMEKAAKDFEAVFMAQMLKPMWEGVGSDPMFGGGAGEEAMRDLLVQEYGKSMATVDSYGLSDMVLGEMMKIQERASL